MSVPDAEAGDFTAVFDELEARHKELFDRHWNRSCVKLAKEQRRLAKAHQRLAPFLLSLFNLSNDALDTLEYEMGQEVAIELIGLLESEERARRIQADFPADEYEFTINWMLLYAYGLLTQHTGSMAGYNSEGLHQCISDGIEVCRRIGKLDSVTLFREIATEIYLSADDVELALHYARMVRSLPDHAERAERRWVGARDEVRILLLRGDFEAADLAARRALTLAESYHGPVSARAETLTLLEEIALVSTRHEAFITEFGINERIFPAGEFPAHDLRCDLRDALAASCSARPDDAIRLLTHWDRWLKERGNLHEWFEVRVRLIAALVVAGREATRPALIKELEQAARPARAWLVLHRLKRLLDPDETPTPLALLGPLALGRFTHSSSTAVTPEREAAETEETEEALPDTPLRPFVENFVERLGALDPEADAARDALLTELLAIVPSTVTEFLDAAQLLCLLPALLGAGTRAEEVWRWAESLARPFASSAPVLSLQAQLGVAILEERSELASLISVERLEGLFRQSLDLDAENPANFARAGAFFRTRNNLGEAERCFARGFRLQRTSSFLALNLAEVYRLTERPRDALAVLDLCLREGNDDPDVAWEAGLGALGVDQFDSMLLYMDQVERLRPGEFWTNYYRALALVMLERHEDGLAAADEEERRNPAQSLPVEIVRAAAFAGLKRIEQFREHLERVLAVPLRTATYLTFQGLVRTFDMLWNAFATLPTETESHQRLADRLLVTGLATEAYFTSVRSQAEPVEGIHFYVCTLTQPLDADWSNSMGCLAGQEAWPAYWTQWGILAPDEAAAQQLALDWQARCAPLPAEVLSIDTDEETFTDRPGVVWQGKRWPPPAPDDDAAD